MRACVQRVSSASVTVDQQVVGRIDRGLVVLLGVGQADTQEDARQLADKITSLRIFEDDAGKMNRSIIEASGSMLVVSQFTLFGDCRKGRRPSFTQAAPPEVADALYQAFVASVGAQGVRVETGVFRA
ncbi:MAG: D-tyrosyl-tRNA(Tyr) deacylase, partial [Planctomycetales bacterium]|nr:D-tyrosyl-tRNA(Tyr) deacylase [Planctomycetales bacterium]